MHKITHFLFFIEYIFSLAPTPPISHRQAKWRPTECFGPCGHGALFVLVLGEAVADAQMFAFQSEKYRRKAAKDRALHVIACLSTFLHVGNGTVLKLLGAQVSILWNPTALVSSYSGSLSNPDVHASWSLELATRCYKQTSWGRKSLGSTDFLPARKTWASMQMASFRLAFGVYVGIPTTSAKWPCGGSLVRMPKEIKEPKLKMRSKLCN